MAKPDRKTFVDRSNQLIAHIRTNLANGTYQVGDYLPSEVAFAEQFDLSKNSVRAAMGKLVEEGLIRKVPRVGTQVAASGRQNALRLGLYPSLYADAKLNDLLASYRREHPEVRVETVTLPYSNPDSIRQLLAYGVVDVVLLNNLDYLYFRDNSLLSLFEPQAPQASSFPFLNKLFMEHTEPDRVFLRPFVFSPVILCYNRDHFREAGAFEPDSSWTWGDLRQTLKKLAGESRYGLFFHLSSNNRWPIFLLQNGVSFAREDGLPHPGRSNRLEAFRDVRELIHEDGLFPRMLSFSLHDVELLFKQEKVSVILTTYYRLNELADAGFPFDIAQLPRSEGGSADTLLLCTGVGVNASSAQKKEAESLASFLLSEEAATTIRRGTFTLPANKRVADGIASELPNAPRRFDIYREMIPSFAAHDRLGLVPEEIETFGKCLGQYYSKLIDEEGLIQMFHTLIREGKTHTQG
ncbi:extracellular solute-binding protein [Paenibacillus antri]|uniref:Extracellular solute-binding protein n=1 Tax=Paenibacillus antri TaxID=2582848 RepID=A0A5R9G9B8_9BACL|nr:extracellular solute-binding protein [Paenibacillus antri]TLS49664.1 extracellular solute-binding protein [Paenibacillus antri]